MVSWGAIFGGFIFYSQYTAVHGGPLWLSKVLPVVLVLLMLGMVLVGLWSWKYRVRRYGFSCPSCGKLLVGRMDAPKIVIASSSCCFCGAKVCE
jgi:uncharacterized iron-regulated membrane protein